MLVRLVRVRRGFFAARPMDGLEEGGGQGERKERESKARASGRMREIQGEKGTRKQKRRETTGSGKAEGNARGRATQENADSGERAGPDRTKGREKKSAGGGVTGVRLYPLPTLHSRASALACAGPPTSGDKCLITISPPPIILYVFVCHVP